MILDVVARYPDRCLNMRRTQAERLVQAIAGPEERQLGAPSMVEAAAVM